jgi:hypothetical protein
MAAKAIKRRTEEKTASNADLRAAEEWVLAELGRPRNLLKVEAKPLWGNYFRVNVYTATDVGLRTSQVEVSDSFFVFKSPEGFLSNPSIVRKYNVI